MPTGTALRDVRQQLFDAAVRVLARDGAEGLTSRAVTTEAGVAKGVLHRHFADFDDFLVELIRDRTAGVMSTAETLLARAGTGTITDNLTEALTGLFGSVTVGVVGLVIFRDELRRRLRAAYPTGIPLLAEATGMLTDYLTAEQHYGRLDPGKDAATMALALIGSGHLIATGDDGEDAVRRVVTTVVGEPPPR